jgi:hypothetical protein
VVDAVKHGDFRRIKHLRPRDSSHGESFKRETGPPHPVAGRLVYG